MGQSCAGLYISLHDVINGGNKELLVSNALDYILIINYTWHTQIIDLNAI